jgi:putative component of membrane protein insertase Oxa1/YidC/SpoIIIJ protein YidD
MTRPTLLVALLTTTMAATHYDAASVAARWALDLYKGNVSSLQGRRICNFNPSCSQFSRQAIERFGPAWGVLMTADRLERCNPYAPSYIGSHYTGVTLGRINDPIADHAPNPPTAGPGGPPATDGLQPPTANSQSPISPNLQLAFADHLFAQADYDRAIGEYRRVAFSDSVPRSRAYARFMIAESFFCKADYLAAGRSFREALSVEYYELANLGLARSLLEQGRFDAARHYAATIRDSGLARQAVKVQADAYFRQHNFRAGSALLAGSTPDSALRRLAAFNGQGIPARSRALSTILSAAIPGLGQAYSGRLGDGLYSFIVVGTCAAVSYYYATHPKQDKDHVKLGIVAGLGLLFHAGNAYGANLAARDYNRLQREKYLNRIHALLDLVDLQPDYRQAVLSGVR